MFRDRFRPSEWSKIRKYFFSLCFGLVCSSNVVSTVSILAHYVLKYVKLFNFKREEGFEMFYGNKRYK